MCCLMLPVPALHHAIWFSGKQMRLVHAVCGLRVKGSISK